VTISDTFYLLLFLKLSFGIYLHCYTLEPCWRDVTGRYQLFWCCKWWHLWHLSRDVHILLEAPIATITFLIERVGRASRGHRLSHTRKA